MDLLDPSSQILQLREDIKKGVYVEGMVEETIHMVSDLFDVMKKGIHNRHISATRMNKESSRSHAVMTIKVESKMKGDVTKIRQSCFHIIDLAGSE